MLLLQKPRILIHGNRLWLAQAIQRTLCLGMGLLTANMHVQSGVHPLFGRTNVDFNWRM